MEAKHLTTKDIMNVLYGIPKLVETTQKELLAIDDLTKEILPRGNDLPHSARDLSRLFEQQKSYCPAEFASGYATALGLRRGLCGAFTRTTRKYRTSTMNTSCVRVIPTLVTLCGMLQKHITGSSNT